MTQPRVREADIVRVIRDYLAVLGVWEIKVQSQGFQRRGVPDILACVPPDGRLLAIEVKGPRGKVSPEQQAELEAIGEAGGLQLVARSLEDVEMVLSEEYPDLVRRVAVL